MLVNREFGGGLARMGKNHGQGTLIGHTNFNCVIPIQYRCRHADGWCDPVRGEQPA